MNYENLEFHELADIFPMMANDEFQSLVADISLNGLLEPIILYEGKILDGRNRYKACQAAMTVEPMFEELDEKTDGDPLQYIISKNLHRRHLTQGQKDMVGAKISTLPRGRPEKNTPNGGFSEAQAAEIAGTSIRGVQRAKRVLKSGIPGLERLVERGELPTSVAESAAKLDSPRQKHFVSQVEGGLDGVKALRKIRQEDRFERLANKALPREKYQIILADPPWRYEHHITDSRKIENQYPTMNIDEICNLQVPTICDKSAVLFLWAPNPKLVEAFIVITAWGFTYRTNAVWVKDKIGMGYYFRQQHELLLVAARGEAMLPLPETRTSSVIHASRQAHSEKPELAYERIESMYPGLKKIELFARNEREGWHSWGNEIERLRR